MSKDPNFSKLVQIVRGAPFPNVPWFLKKNIEDAMDYIPKDDDVIIASYPKTGTTWMNYIVVQIVSNGEWFPSFDASLKTVPFLEMSGIAAVHALESRPRIYKHHIGYNMVQKNDKAKYIYTYRNPEDVVVSFYHFLKSFGLEMYENMDFNNFFEFFVTGDVGYGNYFKHVLSFYERRKDANLLMISYEKLHRNKREMILKIAQFLGEEYHNCLLENEDVLNKVLEHTTFDYMKKNLFFSHPDKKDEIKDNQVPDSAKVNLFRKGIVGDGRSVLTDDQRRRLKEAAQEILNGIPILDEWYSDK